jgi:hypothetical protein
MAFSGCMKNKPSAWVNGFTIVEVFPKLRLQRLSNRGEPWAIQLRR